MDYTETKLSYGIIFWAIGINVTWQWRHNGLALNRISALFGIFFWNALRYVFFAWMSFAVRSFKKIYHRNFEVSWNFYKEGINYACTGLDLMQINLLLFGCYRKGLITHSFFKWPLYTLEAFKRKYSRRAWFRKTRKHMNQGITQYWALFVISKANFTKTAIKTKFVNKFF